MGDNERGSAAPGELPRELQLIYYLYTLPLSAPHGKAVERRETKRPVVIGGDGSGGVSVGPLE